MGDTRDGTPFLQRREDWEAVADLLRRSRAVEAGCLSPKSPTPPMTIESRLAELVQEFRELASATQKLIDKQTYPITDLEVAIQLGTWCGAKLVYEQAAQMVEESLPVAHGNSPKSAVREG
jgi:hypothetical protein